MVIFGNVLLLDFTLLFCKETVNLLLSNIKFGINNLFRVFKFFLYYYFFLSFVYKVNSKILDLFVVLPFLW